jgi:tetratricopeptide (TPR) repeat protein
VKISITPLLTVILLSSAIVAWAQEPVTSKDTPKMREAYENLVLGEKNPASAKNNEGNFFLIKGKYDEAINKYREALAIDPGNTLILDNLSWALIMAARYQEALECLKKSITIDPNNASTNFYLGVAYWMLSDTKDARPNLEKAVLLNPGHPYSHYYLSMVYEEEGDLKNAIIQGELAAYILGKTWNPDIALYLGDLYAHAEMFQKALLQYQKLVDEKDYAFRANYGLGIAYGRFGDEKMSEKHLLMAYRLNDEDPMVSYALGKLYSQDNDELKKALKFAKDALGEEPTNHRFLYLVGWIYYRMGETEDALSYVKKALAADPENVSYRSQVKVLESELSRKEGR